MRIAIQVNGEFLDLPPSTVLELVEENPFLQFAENSILGSYSLPFDIKMTDKNMRLLGYAGIVQTKLTPEPIEAILYEWGNQTAKCKLVFEKVAHILSTASGSTVSMFLLIGASDFYQDMKGKRLRDVDLGGDRSFAMTGFITTGNSFWGHINKLVNLGPYHGYDYAFFPVKNLHEGNRLAGQKLMNYVSAPLNGPVSWPIFLNSGSPPNRIVPFPYLYYVLKKSVEYVGWKIVGDIFSDTTFQKLTMINFCKIEWVKNYSGFYNYSSITWNNPVVFNLQKNMPDISVSEFLLALKSRFGWWFDFDYKNKIITIKPLQNIVSSEVKDFTKYCTNLLPKKINSEKTIYSLINKFSSDLADGQPAEFNERYRGHVNTVADLPAVSDALYRNYYLVLTDNNFYICLLKENSQDLEWKIYTYNIYDYVPDGATKEITTAATTVGMEYYSDTLPLIPRIDGIVDPPNDDTVDPTWGINLAFYHGPFYNLAWRRYPYASNHIYDKDLIQVAAWGLPFICFKTDGEDVGIYNRNYKQFLKMLENAESFEPTLQSLPYAESLNINFGDIISIANIHMLVKNKKRNIPYDGKIILETVRINYQ